LTFPFKIAILDYQIINITFIWINPMKKPFLFLCIVLFFYITGCEYFDVSDPGIKAYYDYSFSNKHVISSDDTTLTYIHNGKKEFDDYFFMIYDHKTPTIIPAEDFDNKIFVSFVKYGLYFSEITLSKSANSGEVLDLYFDTKEYSSPSCYFAVPVIVAVPNGYKKVRIMENNIFLRTLVIE
jgi:hypothetical protein